MGNHFELSQVNRIMELHNKYGMDTSTISEIVGRSHCSVGAYINAIKSAMNGNPIRTNSHTFSYDIVRKYCEQNGVKIATKESYESGKNAENEVRSTPVFDSNIAVKYLSQIDKKLGLLLKSLGVQQE